MANLQDIDTQFLTRAGNALNTAADQLAQDNAEAARKAELSFERILRNYVEYPHNYLHGGFCNLVGTVATLAESFGDKAPEDSEAEADWQFAAQVMDAALAAIDLNYGDRSSKKARQEAFAKLRELVGEIKA